MKPLPAAGRYLRADSLNAAVENECGVLCEVTGPHQRTALPVIVQEYGRHLLQERVLLISTQLLGQKPLNGVNPFLEQLNLILYTGDPLLKCVHPSVDRDHSRAKAGDFPSMLIHDCLQPVQPVQDLSQKPLDVVGRASLREAELSFESFSWLATA